MNNEDAISTGLRSLDSLLDGGFHRASLNMIAARPGMCASLFAVQCAVGMSNNMGKRIYVIFFASTLERLTETYPELCDRSKFVLEAVEDETIITTAEIRSRLAAIPELGAVIISRFQHIRSDNDGTLETDDLKNVVRELGLAAREFDVPIICTACLPRTRKNYKDHKLSLKDFRRCVVSEADVDVVLFTQRDGFTTGQSLKHHTTAEIVVAKNRFGESGVLPFYWDMSYPGFRESRAIE